jgi:hypothetical protein
MILLMLTDSCGDPELSWRDSDIRLRSTENWALLRQLDMAVETNYVNQE